MSYPVVRYDFETGWPATLTDYQSVASLETTHALTGSYGITNSSTTTPSDTYTNIADTVGGNGTFTVYTYIPVNGESYNLYVRIQVIGSDTQDGIRLYLATSGCTLYQNGAAQNTPVATTLPTAVWVCMELRLNGGTAYVRIINTSNGQSLNFTTGAWGAASPPNALTVTGLTITAVDQDQIQGNQR